MTSNLNFNTGKILSNYLPGFDLMKQQCNLNLNIPHCSFSSNLHSSQSYSSSNYIKPDTQSTLTQYNTNTYSLESLNSQVLKIFEFEESSSTKQKKKIVEIKKQEKIQTSTATKKEEAAALNKPGQNAKKTSIEINQSYVAVSEFNKQSLEKFRLDSIENVKPGFSEFQGDLHYFSNHYSKDKLNTLNPVMLLKNPRRNFHSNTTSNEDTNMQEIENFNFYLSDKVLAVIMTMNLNSRPWHINIRKEGAKLFFDIEESSGVYYTDIPEDDFAADEEEVGSINHTDNLHLEASVVNQYVKELVLGEKIVSEAVGQFKSYPFSEVTTSDVVEKTFNKKNNVNQIVESPVDAEKERSAYAYREWSLGDEVKLLVRCQIHAGDLYEDEEGDDGLEKINIFALNEYNKYNFKSTEKVLSTHMKTELTSNHLKLTKWGLQSYLGGIDYMNIGFVSRKDIKSNKEHILYGFHQVEPRTLLNHVNFNFYVGWGIVKQIAETLQSCQNGNYVLMKTLAGPKQLVKLFRKKESNENEGEF
mmetsp:Transcript_30161/g.31367  ORF Transcript_30161/g.31367 Transcript_30161/m.31367 type:complete len:530 (+) Transcript_30161:1-1590(+)